MKLSSKFKPLSVISEEEFSTLFNYIDTFNLGEVTTHSTEEIITLTNLWVERMDDFIYKARVDVRAGKLHPSSIDFLNNYRAFTFDEYKILFKEVKEEKLKHYPIFQFLRIPSTDYLVEFRTNFQETKNDFVKVLTEAINDLDGAGIGFFLHKLKNRIPIRELQRHCYICGATGSGKSELIRLLFYRLAKANKDKKHSLVLIDPHGDLSKQIKNSKIHEKDDRFIYFEPELIPGFTPVINPLELHSKSNRAAVVHAQNLATAIEEAVGIDMSVNMGAILIPCLTLLLQRKGSTLLDLIKLMQDDSELINEGKKLPNQAHRLIFERFRDKHYAKTKTSIFTKLQSFLNYPAFYHATVGKSTINIGRAVNSGKIVVFNLSQNYFGGGASQAYGRFIISMIKSHVTMRGEFRKPTFLFVDEVQNFVSPSIKDILEQTRKYGLHIIMANQSVERLGEVESVVLGNTSVKLVGKNDSIQTNKKMSSITGSDIAVFQNLRNYHFYLKTSYSKGQVFKASDALILDTSLSLSKKESRDQNRRIVDKYYRKIVEYLPENEDNSITTKYDL